MNETDLRAELRNQSDDRPDPAELVAALSRRRTIRRSRFAAGGLAAAVVIIVAVGAAVSSRSTPPAQPGTVPTTRSTAATSSDTAGSTFELVCENPIAATARPDAGLAEVLGVVAFYTRTQELNPNLQQLGPGERPDPAQRYFGKSGLQIRVGRAFRIEVPPAWRGRAEIGWSNISVTPADALTVPACPAAPSASSAGRADSSVDQWLTYPGGIWVSAPACVPLQVITATATATIHIPAGRPCP